MDTAGKNIDLAQPYGTSGRGFHTKNIFADQARLLGAESRIVFDVGAHHGDELPTYLSMFPEAIVHAIEPTPASVAILRESYTDHPRVRIHSGAFAERDGTATLHAYAISVRNALTPYSPEPALGRAPDVPNELVDVQTWTLDRFCADRGIDGIDLLKLDTQGAEGRVLAGASRLLTERRIRLISLEVLFVPLFEGQAEADELVATLRSFGYHLYDWYNFSYNDRGQLLFGDAIFLPAYPQEAIPAVKPEADAPAVAPPQGGTLPSEDVHQAEAPPDHLRARIDRFREETEELLRRLHERDERIRALQETTKPPKR